MNDKATTSTTDYYAYKNAYNELDVLQENFRFQWKLKGFAQVPFITGRPVYSPSFCLGKGSESLWQLLIVKELRSKKTTKSLQDEVLRATGDTPMKISDSEVAETIAGSEKLVAEKTPVGKRMALGFKVIKTEESTTWEVLEYYIQVKIGNFIRRTKEKMETCNPYDKKCVYKYLYEENLTGIDLKEVDTISVEAFIEHKFLDLYPLEPASQFEDCQIAEDLFELYKNPKSSDIVLKAGDSDIPAHKCVLCARSYGFDCYLQENRDIPKLKVEIGLNSEVMKAMLAYIYCGGIPVEFPDFKCLRLFKAAAEYRVPGLRLAIIQFLMKRQKISSNNAAYITYDMIKFSNYITLEQMGMDLISENKYCERRQF